MRDSLENVQLPETDAYSSGALYKSPERYWSPEAKFFYKNPRYWYGLWEIIETVKNAVFLWNFFHVTNTALCGCVIKKEIP